MVQAKEDNIFPKPYVEDAKISYFPYTRTNLTERPIFPTYVFDGGAFFFLNDVFKTANSDDILEMMMSGKFFKFWETDGKFDWCAVLKRFKKCGFTPEWEGHIWLSRLYILLPLAQGYARTGDKKYAKKWIELLRDFMDKNPYEAIKDYSNYKLNSDTLTWVDMQVTWRTINITHSIFLFKDEDVFSKEDWEFIYDTLKLHANHLYNECVSNTHNKELGNHKLQIGMATIMIGVIFPEFGNSESFIECGKRMVEKNLEKDMFDDGSSKEDAISYSHFIARLYLEAHLLLVLNGYEPVEGCAQSIKKQYEHLYQISTPTGKNVQFGDAYAMDAVGDVEFASSVFPVDFDRKKKSVVFEKGKIAVLRNQKYELYIDGMDMASSSNRVYGYHQHWGHPHFVLYVDKNPLVIDSGSTNYDNSLLLYELSKQAGHNVIVCDELKEERWLYSTDVLEETKITDYDILSEEQFITIECKVSKPDGRNYIWVRKFELLPDKLIVTDSVKASEKLHFSSHLHLKPYRLGYIDWHGTKVYPFSEDKKTANIRIGDKIAKVTTDTPFEISCKPCVNDDNKVDVAEVLTRKYYTEAFEETTTICFGD